MAATIPTLADLATGIGAVIVTGSAMMLIASLADRIIGPPQRGQKRHFTEWIAGITYVVFVAIAPAYLLYQIVNGACT